MKKTLSVIMAFTLCLLIFPVNVFSSGINNPVKMVGDLDCDEEITDWDGVLLARYLAGWNVDVPDISIFDIDGDGEITDWDGVMFDRHLAGWLVDTEIGKKLSFNITYLNTKGAINTNPSVLQYGNDKTVLSALSISNYTFDGWYAGGEKYDFIPANQNSDLTFTAKWTPIEYSIIYNNTKGAINDNPSSYNVESTAITLNNISMNGYVFDGWYNGGTRVTSIPSGSSGNIVITAKWTPCDYSITYNNTKGAINNNVTGFNTDSETITLSDIQKEGYTFDGWYQNGVKVTQIDKGTIGNVELTARWTPITYSATFVAEGEIVATRYFTIEDSVLDNIPNVPSKAGYSGMWQRYTLIADNITIYAVYTLNEYTITYSNTKGAENFNPTTYAITTETFELLDLQYDGYDFEGWYRGNTKVEQIKKGSYGNVSLTAKWSATSYTITYSDTKGATNNNPLEYTVETGTIYLKNISAEHYVFDGWYLNGSKVLTIPAGNIGEIELVARWTPISYNLLYQNTKGATNTNPVSYTVEDVIILQEISAEGYIFDGWYLNGEKVETINVGSYGQKILSARWSPITYSITYKNTKDAENSNLTLYTIESNTILLSDIAATGYIFDGWYVNGNKVDKIDTGTFGDIEITAQWTPIAYTLTYDNTKGATNNNPMEYTIENVIALQDISVDGYIFEGWYVGDERVTTIPIGTIGHKTLIAKWSLITYSITYANTKDVVHNNLREYTIESDDIELADISKEGYVFNGWDLNGEVVTKVDSGSFGNIIITALWTPNTYSISYVSKYGDITNDNPIVYSTDSEITLEEAYFDEYHTFEGWFLDSNFESEIKVIQGSRMEDVTLYAKWSFDGTYISSRADFEAIVYNPAGVYELTADISITETICDSTNPFNGYFNGNGYCVISETVAPFEISNGTIKNLTTTKQVCYKNDGIISNCFGGSGITNYNSGTVSECSSTGYVTYYDRSNKGYYVYGSGIPVFYAGGLVAYNSGYIYNCRSGNKDESLEIESTVDGKIEEDRFGWASVAIAYVGGLVGYSTSGKISNCYFEGEQLYVDFYNSRKAYSINSGDNPGNVYLFCGGLIGRGDNTTIDSCYVNLHDIHADADANYPSGAYKWSHSHVEVGAFSAYASKVSKSFAVIDDKMTIGADAYYGGRTFYVFNAKENQKNYYSVNVTDSNATQTQTSNFKSESFIKGNLNWTTTTWFFKNGQYPKLAWE